MPLFECGKCKCIENTACSGFWSDRAFSGIDRPLCSKCKTGKWHGRFEKRLATGLVEDSGGFIWGEEEIENGLSPLHHKISRVIT